MLVMHIERLKLELGLTSYGLTSVPGKAYFHHAVDFLWEDMEWWYCVSLFDDNVRIKIS